MLNILYIDSGFKKGKTYLIYSGLYNELKKISNCFLYEKNIIDISEALAVCDFKPDAIFFGLGWFSSKNYGKIKGLRELNIPLLCNLFKPQNDISQKLDFCKINNIDMILTPVPSYKEYESITGINSILFKYGADPRVFKDYGERKIYDFGFSGAMHDAKHYIKGAFSSEDIRRRVHGLLKNRKDLNCFLNGSDSIHPRINSHKEYAKKINQSKIWLSTPAPFKDMPARYLEIGMSRALIFTSKIPKEYCDLYKDGFNCVQFNDDLSDFIEKLEYYLKNDKERNIIINNAYNDFHKNHTWEKRAEELINIIEKLRR